MERINPPTVWSAASFSQVVIVPAGRQVHVSGQVALDAAAQLVGEGDFAAQTEQVFANLRAALRAAGADLGDVFKMVAYVVGMDDERVASLRAIRARNFEGLAVPASTVVGVSALVDPRFLIEIEASAYLA